MIENSLFLAAAITSLVTMLIHLLVGGRYLVRPLLNSGLHPVVRYTHYFCWHMVTVTIIAMAAMFGVGAFTPAHPGLPLIATALAAVFALLNAALIITFRQSPLKMPQWLLFALITTGGILGLLAG